MLRSLGKKYIPKTNVISNENPHQLSSIFRKKQKKIIIDINPI